MKFSTEPTLIDVAEEVDFLRLENHDGWAYGKTFLAPARINAATGMISPRAGYAMPRTTEHWCAACGGECRMRTSLQ